ncbi:hypothetical protein N7467_001503 [Penicillium canescens]|nr:hypothetical protein N7467_001503 [Penicillium canescens]
MEQDIERSRRTAEDAADPTIQEQHEDNTIYPHPKSDEGGIGFIDVNHDGETRPGSDDLTRQPTSLLAR